MFEKNKKRITFIIGALSCGGAERVLSLLANDWAEKGYEVSVITFSGETPFYELSHEIRFYPLNLHSTNDNFLIKQVQRIGLLRTLIRTIQETKPDVVISFITRTNILSILLARFINVPIIVSERNNYLSVHNKITFLLRKMIYPLADAIHIQTSSDLKFYNKRRTCVIPNPIAFEYVESSKSNVLLCVGRLINRKGFHTLLQNIDGLFNRHPDWILKIVGEGEEHARLQEIIRDSNLENHIILEGQSNDVMSYYREAQIFLLTSEFEGFPNVLLEAMSQSCAVIAYDCYTGPRDIISHEVNGLLIENQNIAKMVKAADRLMQNDQERDAIQKKALQRIRDFNIDRISQQWFDLISKVTENET